MGGLLSIAAGAALFSVSWYSFYAITGRGLIACALFFALGLCWILSGVFTAIGANKGRAP